MRAPAALGSTRAGSCTNYGGCRCPAQESAALSNHASGGHCTAKITPSKVRTWPTRQSRSPVIERSAGTHRLLASRDRTGRVKVRPFHRSVAVGAPKHRTLGHRFQQLPFQTLPAQHTCRSVPSVWSTVHRHARRHHRPHAPESLRRCAYPSANRDPSVSSTQACGARGPWRWSAHRPAHPDAHESLPGLLVCVFVWGVAWGGPVL